MRSMSIANIGETRAKKVLRRYFINVRSCHDKKGAQAGTAFDLTGICRKTGDRIAIEAKTITKLSGKLVHIETPSMERKQQFLTNTGRTGIILVVHMVAGQKTGFYFSELKQHVSKGCLTAA